MSAVPTTYGWVDATELATNGYYRFVALVPPTWTMAQTQAYLDPDLGGKLGWSVKSISAPPANVAAALATAKIVFPAGGTPVAWWVNATWPGGPGTPATDPQLVYAELQAYVPVAAGTAGDSTNPDPIPATPQPVWPVVVGLVSAALIAWSIWDDVSWLASKVKGSPADTKTTKTSKRRTS